LGATTSEVKAFEAQECLEAGAEEIDMVIPVGKMIAGDHTYVVRYISAVVSVCKKKDAICKVILETALLTSDQIAKASELSILAGADLFRHLLDSLREVC
jgi:deoxyribose-phosphate aldolase